MNKMKHYLMPSGESACGKARLNESTLIKKDVICKLCLRSLGISIDDNKHMVQCVSHEPGKSCDIYSSSWKCGVNPCNIDTQNHI